MSAHDLTKRPERLEHEVEAIRENLTGIVSELDHRRHELLDVRLQLRRHGSKLAVAAGVIVLLVGASILLGVRRRSRERQLVPRMRKMRRALSRFVDDPDRVAPEPPSIARKALMAIVTTAAATLAKRSAARIFDEVKAARV